MLNFLKHIYKEHNYLVFAILVIIVIFSALPNQDISRVPDIKIATVQRVMAIGKVSFEGAGDDYLALRGRYEGDKKAIYNIVINDEVNGTKNFKWNKDNGPYVDSPLTDKEYELPDGIIIKFDPTLSYQQGDSWTIDTGTSTKFNIVETAFVKTGRQIASLYLGFSHMTNQFAAEIGDLFSPQSNLALRQAIGGGSLATTINNNRGSSAIFGSGETALFDIEIAPTEVKSESKVLPAIVLILIILILLVIVVYLIQITKKRASNKGKI